MLGSTYLSCSSECPAKSILWNSLILINPQAVQRKRKWKRESCALDCAVPAVPAVLQSHGSHGSGAWAWLSWPLCQSRTPAVKVSARLCSHMGARLGKYMLSESPPTSAVTKPTYGGLPFTELSPGPWLLADCGRWAGGPASAPGGGPPFLKAVCLYHDWLSQDGSKTLEQVTYSIMSSQEYRRVTFTVFYWEEAQPRSCPRSGRQVPTGFNTRQGPCGASVDSAQSNWDTLALLCCYS